MSSSKVKPFSRLLTVATDTVTGTGPYTHTVTTGTHYLQTGETVRVASLDNGESFNVTVTVTNATTFAFSTPFKTSTVGLQIIVEFYSAGQTGGQPAVTWPQSNVPGVIQIVSTGAATVAIEGSLDNTNFVNLTTFTLVGAGTNHFVLNANWAFVRANITSIDVTKTIKIYRSV